MVSIIWFLNHCMVPLYGFSIIVWFYYMVSQSLCGSIRWFLNHCMVPLYGFSIIVWFHYMVSQSSYGSIIWFLNHRMVPLYGFSVIVWFHYMVSQSSYGSIIWFLNHRMVPLYGFSIIIWFHFMVSQSSYGIPKYGFSIKKWYPKIWFLNQNLVNYMFPNQTSAFSRYSATDSSKCISATDSSCFRAIIECITSYDSSVWFKLIVYKVKYSTCCLNIRKYFLLIIFVCFSIYEFFFSIFIMDFSNGLLSTKDNLLLFMLLNELLMV